MSDSACGGGVGKATDWMIAIRSKASPACRLI